MSEVFHTELFKDVVILVDVERRTVFRSELAVAMKCGFWKTLVKICEDFDECLFLFWGACVLGFEFAVSRATADVANSDGVLVISSAMNARNGLVASLVDGAVEINQPMVPDMGPVVVLNMHPCYAGNCLLTALRGGGAVADDTVDFSHKAPPSSFRSILDFSSANLVWM